MRNGAWKLGSVTHVMLSWIRYIHTITCTPSSQLRQASKNVFLRSQNLNAWHLYFRGCRARPVTMTGIVTWSLSHNRKLSSANRASNESHQLDEAPSRSQREIRSTEKGVLEVRSKSLCRRIIIYPLKTCKQYHNVSPKMSSKFDEL